MDYQVTKKLGVLLRESSLPSAHADTIGFACIGRRAVYVTSPSSGVNTLSSSI